jgi:hypothetical protein
LGGFQGKAAETAVLPVFAPLMRNATNPSFLTVEVPVFVDLGELDGASFCSAAAADSSTTASGASGIPPTFLMQS